MAVRYGGWRYGIVDGGMLPRMAVCYREWRYVAGGITDGGMAWWMAGCYNDGGITDGSIVSRMAG